MSRKVFVGGLPWACDDSELQAALEQFGPVESAKVILDKETEKSRGFGFVTFVEEDDARGACDTGVIDIEVAGRRRTCRIDLANEKPQRSGPRNDGRNDSPRGGAGRGGRGGGRSRKQKNKWDESDRGRRHTSYEEDDYGGGYNSGGGWNSR